MIPRRLAALLPLLALTACPRFDPMQRQQKYKAYEPSDYYPDGSAMRQPPPGTVQYGSVLPASLALGVGPDGKPLAQMPVEPSADLLARGRERFDVYCAVCHGVLGDGQSQVALNMSLRRPPSLHQFRELPDGYLYQVVTRGFGLMPSYANQLPIRDRWAVVAYVRALQLSQHATLEDVPPAERDRLQKEAR